MGKGAEKLFQAMCRTKAGWKASDFRTLYLGFGFVASEKGRDTQYSHPQYPDLVAYVSRSSGDLATGYAATAVKIISKLKARQGHTDTNS
ncbi:MAG: hypothetical protein AKCLJLPJ_01445 [Fimbriimonadales bacterium]|nr:MAG: hypothetical protein EDM73_02120 [Armatimonadota bacterium]MBC6970423.1 hypothetical protein [Armatimonadota bacterium]MBV6503375.1 hypothetical protein [Fimbriimonadales bacterium]MCE7899828.1 hypothetical protein [Armatimonadetes bacterium ATM1]